MSDVLKIILITIVVILAVVFGPLLGVWALNTLFATGIAYTFKTWLAMLLLESTIASRTRSKK
jgi:hypothetical protein